MVLLAIARPAPAAGGGGGELAGDLERRIVALHARARSLSAENDVDQAAEHLRQAAVLAEAGSRPALAAALLLALGNLLTKAGRVQEAVIAHEQGLRNLAGDDRFELADLLADLRDLEKGFSSGTSIVAEDLYTPELAAELRAAANDPALHLELLLGVANGYLGQSQDAVALEHFDRALARPELARHPLVEARLSANSAVALRRLGRIQDARARLGRALALFAEADDTSSLRSALSTLASIELESGNLDEAVRHYRRAAELHQEAGDGAGLARASTGLGRAHLAAGRPGEAIAALEKARRVAESVYDSESRLFSSLGLGIAYRRVGNTTAAVEALEEALKLIERQRGELRTDEGKVAYFDSVASVYDELLDLHLGRIAEDPTAWIRALVVSEAARGRALEDLVGSRRRGEAAYAPMQSVAGTVPFDPRAQMAVGTPIATGDPLARPPDEPELDVSQSAVATGVPPPARREPGRIELRDPDAVPRLSFHVLADRTAVFFVAADGEVSGHVAAIGRQTLLERLAALRAALGIDASLRGVRNLGTSAAAGPRAEPGPILDSLYRALVTPLEASLPPDGTTLALLPHGPLWLVPLAALTDGSGRSLAERWPLLHATSWRSLEEIRREVPKRAQDMRLLAVGNPSFQSLSRQGLRFEALPGAEAEARQVAALVPTRATLLVGADATYRNVVAHIVANDVVHLATHGIASDEDPLSSLLLLAGDGRLTARHVIRDLDVPAQLVVLSACQTGLGRSTGDGTVGLSRAFLAAGARSVIVSLWSVDDHATARLMDSFYRAWLAGSSKARALQRAMAEVRSEAGHESPAYWAPFVLVGAED